MKDETVRAIADATKEVAVTARDFVPLLESTGKFFERFLGESIALSGEMLSDQVRHWRWMRLVDLEVKFEEKCLNRGFDPDQMRRISAGQAELLIDAAAREDSDEVRELWASLLTNAVDPSLSISLNKTFIFLLQQFGPNEAVLLKMLGDLRKFKNFNTANHQENIRTLKDLEEKSAEAIPDRWKHLSDEEKMFAIGNLQRLRCVAPVLPYAPDLKGLVSQLPVGISGARSLMPQAASSIDIQKFNRLLQWISNAFFVLSGNAPSLLPKTTLYQNEFGYRIGEVEIPELNLYLTEIGTSLLMSCKD